MNLLNKLFNDYVSNKSQTILNQILINLINIQHPLQCILSTQIVYLLQQPSSKHRYPSIASLLHELIIRCKTVLSTAAEKDIQTFCNLCQKHAFTGSCTNQFLELLSTLAEKIWNNQVKEITHQILTDKRLSINQLRQRTRLCLYRLLLIAFKDSPQKYPLNTLLTHINSEADPRNISIVFSIILQILGSKNINESILTDIFQFLQAYYPIDFAGSDEDQQELNLGGISELLDECLCHQSLISNTAQLLISKIQCPPIAQFVPTISKVIYRAPKFLHPSQILTKLSRDIYLQEQVTINLIVNCLEQLSYQRNRKYSQFLKINHFLTLMVRQSNHTVQCSRIFGLLFKNQLGEFGKQIANMLINIGIQSIINSDSSVIIHVLSMIMHVPMQLVCQKTKQLLCLKLQQLCCKDQKVNIIILKIGMNIYRNQKNIPNSPSSTLLIKLKRQSIATVNNTSVDLQIRKCHLDYLLRTDQQVNCNDTQLYAYLYTKCVLNKINPLNFRNDQLEQILQQAKTCDLKTILKLISIIPHNIKSIAYFTDLLGKFDFTDIKTQISEIISLSNQSPSEILYILRYYHSYIPQTNDLYSQLLKIKTQSESSSIVLLGQFMAQKIKQNKFDASLSQLLQPTCLQYLWNQTNLPIQIIACLPISILRVYKSKALSQALKAVKIQSLLILAKLVDDFPDKSQQQIALHCIKLLMNLIHESRAFEVSTNALLVKNIQQPILSIQQNSLSKNETYQKSITDHKLQQFEAIRSGLIVMGKIAKSDQVLIHHRKITLIAKHYLKSPLRRLRTAARYVLGSLY